MEVSLVIRLRSLKWTPVPTFFSRVGSTGVGWVGLPSGSSGVGRDGSVVRHRPHWVQGDLGKGPYVSVSDTTLKVVRDTQ